MFPLKKYLKYAHYLSQRCFFYKKGKIYARFFPNYAKSYASTMYKGLSTECSKLVVFTIIQSKIKWKEKTKIIIFIPLTHGTSSPSFFESAFCSIYQIRTTILTFGLKKKKNIYIYIYIYINNRETITHGAEC